MPIFSTNFQKFLEKIQNSPEIYSSISSKENIERIKLLHKKELEKSKQLAVLSDEFAYRSGTEAEFIRTKAGIASKKNKNGNLILNGYNASMVKNAIINSESTISESDVLRGVRIIKGECNLIGTTLENFGKVSHILGTLILDAESGLKDLSSIKRITNGVIVHNILDKKTLDAYIHEKGLSNAKITGRIINILS